MRSLFICLLIQGYIGYWEALHIYGSEGLGPAGLGPPTGLRRRDTIYPSLFLGKVVSLLDRPFAGKHLLLARWLLTETELFLFVSNNNLYTLYDGLKSITIFLHIYIRLIYILISRIIKNKYYSGTETRIIN